MVPSTIPIPVWHIFPLLVIQALYVGLDCILYEYSSSQGNYFFAKEEHIEGIQSWLVVIFFLSNCVIFFLMHYLTKARLYLTEAGAAPVKDRGVNEEEEVTMDSVASDDPEKHYIPSKPIEIGDSR